MKIGRRLDVRVVRSLNLRVKTKLDHFSGHHMYTVQSAMARVCRTDSAGSGGYVRRRSNESSVQQRLKPARHDLSARSAVWRTLWQRRRRLPGLELLDSSRRRHVHSPGRHLLRHHRILRPQEALITTDWTSMTLTSASEGVRSIARAVAVACLEMWTVGVYSVVVASEGGGNCSRCLNVWLTENHLVVKKIKIQNSKFGAEKLSSWGKFRPRGKIETLNNHNLLYRKMQLLAQPTF